MPIMFVVTEHIFPTSDRGLRTSIKSMTTIRILLCQHKDLRDLENTVYSTVQKFTEKQQFNTIPVPFVNGKHISSSDYKEQTWKEVFYKSDHKKRTILEVFVWLVPLRESVLFWAWGFVCFELWVEGGGGCCWGFFLFFYLPRIHNIPCT